MSTAAAAPAETRLAEETRAVALVVGSMVSLQVGTAIAISAFDDAGPLEGERYLRVALSRDPEDVESAVAAIREVVTAAVPA